MPVTLGWTRKTLDNRVAEVCWTWGKNHISVEVQDENMWTSFSLTADGALIKLRNSLKFRLTF